MGNIVVGRYGPQDGQSRTWQGWIEPEDRTWIAFIDTEGRPTFFLDRDSETGGVRS